MMTIILNILALLVALGEAVYLQAIFTGRTAALETELTESFTDFSGGTSDRKKQAKVWIIFLITVLIQAGYLYFAYITIDNTLFDIFTSCTLGVAAYSIVKTFHGIARYFSGNAGAEEIFFWGTERIACVVMFTHALLVLLYPLAMWL